MKLDPGSRLAKVMNHWWDAIHFQGVEAPHTLSRLIALAPLIKPSEWGGWGKLTVALGAVLTFFQELTFYLLVLGYGRFPRSLS